jgi:hypothetical protein
MKTHQAMLAALALGVTVVSIASAGPAATKQRVAFDAKILPEGTFVLTPLQAGALKRDSGSFGGPWRSATCRQALHDGQSVMSCTGTWTLTGKRGTLTIRESNEWVDVGNDDGVAVGSWKVVRGTGQYAGTAGFGRSGHAGLGVPWYARYEGFITSSEARR